MGGYSRLYLFHFLLFAVLTIITFVLDPVAPAETCTAEDEIVDPSLMETMMTLARYCYIGCTGIAFFIYLLSNYFSSNFLPGDFGKLGRLRGCAGCLLRMFVSLITVVHWLLVIPMIYMLFFYFVVTTDCYTNKMGTKAYFLFAVPVIWLI